MADVKSSPARGWTPKYLESLRPKGKAYELGDPGTSGLRLRVLPSGAKVFRWYVRSLNRVAIIGPWSLSEAPAHVTLAQAQDWLRRLKAARAAGEPQLNAALAQLQAELSPKHSPFAGESSDDTVKDVAGAFYERRIVPHRKRPEQARKILDDDIIPVIGSRPISAVSTAECAALIESVVDRPAPAWAGKVLGLLKQLFRFAEGRDLIQRNPAARLDPDDLGIVVGTRKRWLTAEELPLFWKALDAQPEPAETERRDPRTGKVQHFRQRFHALAPATAAALRVLLLTGVRTGELLRAKWEHLDLEKAVWTIPVENQKLTLKQAAEAKPWEVPLPPAAVELFKDLRALAGKSPWVMASTSSDAGRYDDKSLGHAMRRLFEGAGRLQFPGGPASPHDLRRTMRTHLGKLRVPLHLVERCLNHRLGRIVETYDRNDYLDERREALEKWAAYVHQLVTGDTSVTVLPRSAGGTP